MATEIPSEQSLIIQTYSPKGIEEKCLLYWNVCSTIKEQMKCSKHGPGIFFSASVIPYPAAYLRGAEAEVPPSVGG